MNIEAIQTLRRETGAGLADCRAALEEHGGDVARAIASLLHKGAQAAERKAERTASEGIALARVYGRCAVLLEVNTQTDFVAQNALFRNQVDAIAEAIALNHPHDVTALKRVPLPQQATTVGELVQKMVISFGENIVIRRFAALSGSMPYAYMHQDGKIGVILNLDGPDSVGPSQWEPFARELTLQIAAMKPLVVSREDLEPAALEAMVRQIEADIAADEILGQKPAEIQSRAAAGRLEKYFRDNVLLEQSWIRDDAKTVREMLETANTPSGPIRLLRFYRYERGDGIETEPVFCPLFGIVRKG